MNYFYYILSYIIDNPSYAALLVLILFAVTAYLLKRKIRNKSKYKKSTTPYTNTSSGGSSAYKPYKRNYVVEHSSEHSRGSSFFVIESVSQVFESKTQGRSK
ncbi:hypothetical protein [Ehrlichia muris]|uniref:Uncharacterized protein n=1 Tax=Ehrlichia muris AS145 TaxID=1423892 RepID=V9R6L9_9RICK|nr:hypothetical protein [Ehrlichia muris]AHC38958.1 hypothetical protein EMUR_00580 [Ehrlichia muris AS145]